MTSCWRAGRGEGGIRKGLRAWSMRRRRQRSTGGLQLLGLTPLLLSVLLLLLVQELLMPGLHLHLLARTASFFLISGC